MSIKLMLINDLDLRQPSIETLICSSETSPYGNTNYLVLKKETTLPCSINNNPTGISSYQQGNQSCFFFIKKEDTLSCNYFPKVNKFTYF